jgi:hypothetical protein
LNHPHLVATKKTDMASRKNIRKKPVKGRILNNGENGFGSLNDGFGCFITVKLHEPAILDIVSGLNMGLRAGM